MKNYMILGAIVLIVASAFMFYETSDKTARSSDQKSIYVVSMTADEMSKALVNNSIAGFISWEPNPSKAVSEGYGKYLVNSKDIWENHPSCVLAISEDLKDEDMIKALVWAEVKGTRFINNPVNREIVLEYGQEFSGINENMTSAVINNTVYIEYPDLNETKRAIDIMSKTGILTNNITSLGYTDVDDFLSKLYITKYYDEVRKNLDDDPNWVPPRVNKSIRFGYIEGNSHYFAIYVAQKLGYFEKVGLVTGKNLQLIGYRSGRAVTDALNHQEIDAAIAGTSVLLRYKINENGRIHIVNGVNSGGTSLVVRADSNITSIDGLSGQKIATPGFGTCQDTIMRKMFDGYEIKTQ
ncbi:MAG: ABC transporter substrate-binding protein [Candidatus Methanoperedens sp.]